MIPHSTRALRLMFRNVRCLPTAGERLAVVARLASGAPWVQVEAIIGEQEASSYARELAKDYSQRETLVAVLEADNRLFSGDDAAIMPMIGQVWTHKSGRLYIVEGMANLYDSDSYPASVVYRGEDGLLFQKPFLHWYDSMTFQADATPVLHAARRDWWTVDYRKDMGA